MPRAILQGDIVEVHFEKANVHNGLQFVNHNPHVWAGNDPTKGWLLDVRCFVEEIPQGPGDLWVLERIDNGTLHSLNPSCSGFSGMTLIMPRAERDV